MMGPKMKLWKVAVVVGISGFLVFLFFQRIYLGNVIAILLQVNPIYPLVFSLAFIPHFWIRAHRWGILLKPYKAEIPIGSLYHATVIGYLISYLLPGRLGEIARPVILAEKEKIKKPQAIATIVLERLIDALIIFSFFLLSVFFLGSNKALPLARIRRISLIVTPILLFLVLAIYLLGARWSGPFIEKFCNCVFAIFPARSRKRLTEAALTFTRALHPGLDLRSSARLGLLSVGLWVYIIPFYWFLMRGFVQMRMTIVETVPYFAILYISGIVPTPGMAGSLDLASRVALTGLFRIEGNTAVAYTLLFHFLQVAVPVILGLAALWREGLNLKKIWRFGKKDELPGMQ